MILVTGAAGLSGSIVIREFVRQQQPVRALVRDRTKAKSLGQLPTVEVVEGDMLRPETLNAALDGVDRALMISTSGPEMVDTNARSLTLATPLVSHTSSSTPVPSLRSGLTPRTSGSLPCMRRSSTTWSFPGLHGRICDRASSCKCTFGRSERSLPTARSICR
jgi:putative NAD(P)-binding protein